MIWATTVSVIMRVFDRARYLRTSVESVLATGYPALELLAVDDGSTDGSGAILEEVRATYPRVGRILRNPGGRNLGPSASRNLAISPASGECVCFLDSDDIMLPQRFARSVGLLDGDSSLDAVVEVTELLFENEADRVRWANDLSATGRGRTRSRREAFWPRASSTGAAPCTPRTSSCDRGCSRRRDFFAPRASAARTSISGSCGT